jgi:phenylacetate-CoA ligase
MTNLAEEQAEQERWNACAQGGVTIFNSFVEREFVTPERQHELMTKRLAALMRFAGLNVPYYRDLFARLKLDPVNPDVWENLHALPVLGKLEVKENSNALRAPTLPKGETLGGATASSGTTGRPTVIFQTLSCMRMFGLLMQRHYRWFRLDPRAKLASIRLASQLPKLDKNARPADGETFHFQAWQYLETDFRTGLFVGYSVTNPVENQIVWLRRERPDYLVSYSESLEHLAFAAGDERPVDSLKAVIAISEQLTEGMRERITRGFGVPIHQGYGLNEIGLVACRCEAGRYHVHVEHCQVEILNEQGRACALGETGRVVVTALGNAAMPLLRYDTGDLAEAVAGDCPCGRTLPAFGGIVGRYSRIAYLPEGTLGLVDILRSAVEAMPLELTRDLRQFQIHQSRDHGFELRLAARAPLPAGFAARVRGAWEENATAQAMPLAIVEVEEISRARGGKFQVFTSDFMPVPTHASGDPRT